ncbi:MAG: hypothetical protein CVU90_14910 [Firmicutes bacterium HGW-Firmicutes-15]|nr:MAG: hypothetical protein CVU90_14910 [Firmicutes bacterium HGW-Firmicutes-15]
MSIRTKIRNSIKQNPSQWMLTGGLTLFISFIIISLSWGFSFFYLFVFIILGTIGAAIVKPKYVNTQSQQKIKDAIDDDVLQMMNAIKLSCDEMLVSEIGRITQPVISGIREDFAKSLNWLWEDGDNYLAQVEVGMNETRSVIQMVNTLSDDSMKIEQKLQTELDTLINAVNFINSGKEKDNEYLEECLRDKAENLVQGIEGEIELFYDYVQKLLIQQLKNNQEELIMDDYFKNSQLGEQFSLVVEKAVQGKLAYYEDSIIKELEEMSADIVGRMQSGALRVMNIFKNIENLIDKMVDEYRGDNTVALRRLSDSRHRISQLKEQANDIMVTLAWQDILVERRWEDTQEKLFVIKDKVMKNVSEDVIEYLQNSLDDEISGYRVMADNPANALIYKAVLDAEVIYQVFVGENLLDVIGDGVNALLQFLRPVELMVSREVRLSDSLIKQRRYIKDQIRQAEYQGTWDKVIGKLESNNEDLPAYLEDIYPLGFASFCNSPYIHQKPENLNQAGWMIFMVLLNNQSAEDEVYILAALLLIMHRLRNKYIHPLKSIPLPLQEFDEIRHIRYCAWQSMEILQNLDMKTLLRTKRKLA